jgi:Polysaccharide deacetylase
MSRIVRIITGFAFFALLLVVLWHFLSDRVFHFPGLSGPVVTSTVRPEAPTPPSDYGGGKASRMAILLTDSDSSWLGLVHGLKSFGIPFTLTEDYREALQHSVVMVYPVISGKAMTAQALSALTEFTQQGGTLVATNVLGGGLNGLFGFSEAVASKAHTHMRFGPKNAFVQSYFGKAEQNLTLASPAQPRGAYSYSRPTGTVLAQYEDGSPALISNTLGKGHTYALGLDIGALALLGYNTREEGLAKTYVNSFEPGLDIAFLWLRDLYVKHEPDAVLLGTVPDGKRLSIVLTHDIDYTESVNNSLIYAQYQKSQDIAGTYFIQTKYVRDWNDDIFFNTDGAAKVKQLADMGMEVASHSVAHSKVFSKIPLGSGTETYPAYEPFVKSRTETLHASILGELRISRYLLEANVPKLTVESFRSGHLQNPETLPQALEATGYRYSSSTTANNSLTHLPFRLNYNRRSIDETGVFEFPITIEDEIPPLMGSRLPQALEIAEKIQRYGGLYVVLTHPNILGHKLDFTRGLVKKMKPTAWFGTLASFGQWWAARDQVSVDVETRGSIKTVTLTAPELIDGLSIEVPAGWRFAQDQHSELAPVLSGRKLLLPTFQGNLTLQFSNL